MEIYTTIPVKSINHKHWYAESDLAELVGIPAARSIRRARREGEIRYFRCGVSILYPGQWIISFLSDDKAVSDAR